MVNCGRAFADQMLGQLHSFSDGNVNRCCALCNRTAMTLFFGEISFTKPVLGWRTWLIESDINSVWNARQLRFQGSRMMYVACSLHAHDSGWPDCAESVQLEWTHFDARTIRMSCPWSNPSPNQEFTILRTINRQIILQIASAIPNVYDDSKHLHCGILGAPHHWRRSEQIDDAQKYTKQFEWNLICNLLE